MQCSSMFVFIFTPDQGRMFKAQFFFTPSANPQDTISIYDEIRQQNTVCMQCIVSSLASYIHSVALSLGCEPADDSGYHWILQ